MTAPENLPELQTVTARSQSVKGPRVPTVLSPVQVSASRSSKGRTVVAGANSSRTTASAIDNSARLPQKSGVVSSSGKVTVSSNLTKPTAVSAKSSPSLATAAVLSPVRAGKVTAKPNGLKAFDQSIDDEESTPDIASPSHLAARAFASVLGKQLNLHDADTLVTMQSSANSSVVTTSARDSELPPGLAPLKRMGASPNSANLARRSAGFRRTIAGSDLSDQFAESLRAEESEEAHSPPLERPRDKYSASPFVALDVHDSTNTLTSSAVSSLPALAPREDILGHLAHADSRVKPSSLNSSPEISLVLAPALMHKQFETAAFSVRKTRSSLPSERQELSAAHEDAQGSHLSELETQYLRAVSHTVLNEIARCIRMGVDVKVKNSFGRYYFADCMF